MTVEKKVEPEGLLLVVVVVGTVDVSMQEVIQVEGEVVKMSAGMWLMGTKARRNEGYELDR